MNGHAHSWTTDHYAPRERYEAWDQKLNEVYGVWHSDRNPGTAFNARIEHRKASGFQIVDCRCDPCGAVRYSRDSTRGQDEMVLALQWVLEGREEFCIDDRRMLLERGDVLIWDTTKPMSFKVVEPLHKISTMIPLSRLQHWMPGNWRAVEGKIAAGSMGARLLSNYVAAIRPEFLSGSLNNPDGLVEATIGLIVNALGDDARQLPPESLRDAQMQRVKAYIKGRLDDPDLGPTTIAAGCRISVRYLHWLFAPTDTTVSSYLMQERLALSRRALANLQMARRTIADIALSSGFLSSTHFSRRFKAEYGETPMEFRMRSYGSSARLLA